MVEGERSMSPEVGSWPEVGELESKWWAKLHKPEVVRVCEMGSRPSHRDVRRCWQRGLEQKREVGVGEAVEMGPGGCDS